jgi:hypothetical protein
MRASELGLTGQTTVRTTLMAVLSELGVEDGLARRKVELLDVISCLDVAMILAEAALACRSQEGVAKLYNKLAG